MSNDAEEKGFTVRDRRAGAKQDDTETPEGSPPDAGPDANGTAATEPGGAAEASITSLVLWLAGMAHAGLGEIPDPVTGQLEKNLEASRQIIDLLGVLEQKTKGNLTEDEARIMATITTELRIRYVQTVNTDK